MQGITELNILNFQSHQETEMIFSPGLNVITGDSDAGKSTIIKALTWLFTNRPSGDEFKNWDAPLKEPVTVECVIGKDRISLTRENNKNSYLINGGDPLSAIKTDVPQEVSDILNVSEYNIQGQHDTYFLLKDSPGIRAQKLNELVGMDVIDTLYKNIGSKIRELNSNIVYLKETSTKTEEDLKKYENLPEIEKLVTSIEKNHAEASAFAATATYIREKLIQLEEIKIKQEKLAPLIDSETEILKLINKTKEYWALREKKELLQGRLTILKEVQKEMESDRGWIELESPVQLILDKIKSYTELKIRKDEVLMIMANLTDCQTNKDKMDSKLRELIKKYVSLVKQAGTCPTCGTKLEGKKLNEIQNFLVKI
jgi:exonuclease SbcC